MLENTVKYFGGYVKYNTHILFFYITQVSLRRRSGVVEGLCLRLMHSLEFVLSNWSST